MEFNREMGQAVKICAIIVFLIADLYFIDNVVTNLFGQISNQQYITTGMIAKNQTTAQIYAGVGLTNQEVYLTIGCIILIFLGYIGNHTIGLLRAIIENGESKSDNTDYNNTSKTNNKNPKHHS